jgi:glycosyltransferase involved in cell wall biosynthesis
MVKLSSMRILIITTRFAPHLGGVETVVEELAQRFSDEGHEVSVLASMDLNSNTGVINKFFGIETKSIQYKNFTLKRIWMEWPSSVLGYLLYPVRLILSVIALSNYIKGFNPEVINFHFPDSASIYLRIALSNKQLPLVVNVHGNDLHVFSKKYPYKFFIEWLVSKASRLIVNSDYMLNELKGRFNNINEKITKIPNGLDLETFDNIEPRKYFDEEYIF